MDISNIGGWVATAASILTGAVTYGKLTGDVSGLKKDRDDHSERIGDLEGASRDHEGRLGHIEGHLGIQPK